MIIKFPFLYPSVLLYDLRFFTLRTLLTLCKQERPDIYDPLYAFHSR